MAVAKSLDGVLTKKAHATGKYTKKQIEQLKKCSDPDTGYMYFIENFFYIQHPVQGKMIMKPYEFQRRMIESYHTHRNVISLCPRQQGKTTCAAAYLLWYSMFNNDKTILIAAHKYSGAQEIMLRIRYGYELCPDHIRCGVVNYNKGTMEFDNGSRIVSTTTTENTGRGMSVSLLYCDEMAHLQSNIATEFWASISPTLSTGGRVIITSTPNSDEDQFALIWKGSQEKFDEFGEPSQTGIGKNGFFGFRSYWQEHPDRDDAWKQHELNRIGEENFKREYECEFLIFEETLIKSSVLATLAGKESLFKTGQVRWYKKPEPNMMYLVALDPSLGTGGNNSAIEVFELPYFTQVAEWHHNSTPVQGQIKILRDILRYIQKSCGAEFNSNIYWSCENNTVGEAALVVINELGEESFPGYFLSEPAKYGKVKKYRKGFNTTFSNKISTCARLKFLIEENKMILNSYSLISELKGFVSSGLSFKAKPGVDDDLVSALLLIIRMSTLLSDWDPRVFDALSVGDSYDTDWEEPLPLFVSYNTFTTVF